jgi:hypothetical protein
MRSLISVADDASTTPPGVETAAKLLPAEPLRPRAGATSAVIAGVGVLLLAMGVGVLIGHTGGSNAKVSTQPAQVISVATPGTDTGTSGASQAPSSTTSSSKSSSTKHPSPKASSSESSTAAPSGGVGQTPSKPAPPSVAEHLKGVKGGSYEQKSKNLPNVISTG